MLNLPHQTWLWLRGTVNLTLTPAYDICPQNRTGNEASQAMLIVDDKRISNLATCLEAAPNFQLDQKAAEDLIIAKIEAIQAGWRDVCEESDLSEVERNMLERRVFFNHFIFEGAPERLNRGRLG